MKHGAPTNTSYNTSNKQKTWHHKQPTEKGIQNVEEMGTLTVTSQDVQPRQIQTDTEYNHWSTLVVLGYQPMQALRAYTAQLIGNTW